MVLNCAGAEAVLRLCCFLTYCWQFNEQLKHKPEEGECDFEVHAQMLTSVLVISQCVPAKRATFNLLNLQLYSNLF